MDGFYDKPFYSCKNKIKTKELKGPKVNRGKLRFVII